MDLAISYIRFSSKKQVQSDSLRRQLENTRTYAKTHNLLLDESITYQDQVPKGCHCGVYVGDGSRNRIFPGGI
jgi:hypothetical protein